MGRHKLPDELKKMRSTDQPCRMTPAAVGFQKSTEVPKVKWLKGNAKKIFADVAQQLINCNVLDLVSIPMLAAYAKEIAIYYDLMKEIEDNIETDGFVIDEKTKTGIKKKINPKRTAALQALQMAKNIASDFGFTPATKARIAAILNSATSIDNNEFTEFEEI